MTELYTYVFNKTISKHITFGDIKRMKVGDTLDVVIFDRNFEEYHIWKNTQKCDMYLAKDIFVQNRHTLEFLENHKWKITYPYGESIDHPIHIIHDDCWEIANTCWDVIPDYTRVGWRGPMMLWSDLGDDQVFWTRP